MTCPRDIVNEDVSWLCFLSQSGLDLLIRLKKLALKRASVIGHVQLTDKFNLKMLRVLGFILMEHLKVQVQNLPLIPDMADSATHKLDEMMSFEEVQECLAFVTRKEFRKRKREKDAVVRSKRSRSAEELKKQRGGGS